MAKKAINGLRCQSKLKAKAGTKGLCYRIERVQRDKKKGYITAFFSRSSGKAAGFSTSPGACRKTLDPFQASIRQKGQAEEVGKECAKASAGKKK